MAVETQKIGDNVIAFAPLTSNQRLWTAAQQFGNFPVAPAANENHALSTHEGAQTSDMVLEFLRGVTCQAN